MFNTLRGKLIGTYALVIVLSLLLAGVAFAVEIRTFQTQRQLDDLVNDVMPLAFQVRGLERTGATTDDIARILRTHAQELNVRILLVGANGRILVDSDNALVGQTAPVSTHESRRLGMLIQSGEFPVAGIGPMTFVQVGSSELRLGRPLPPNTAESRLPDYDLIVAVPEARVTSAWVQLLPNLGVAALVAFILSTIVALFFARSIARPIAQVTAASDRMARGDFDQFIPVTGTDEVGHLARSFNTMAQEVGRMHRAMRDLLANVSHELRTPLTSIEGFSQAMVDGTLRTPGEFRDAALVIGEEAERMNRLVGDLLYLSRIESGQISIEHAPLSVPDLLQSCARQIQPQAESGSITVAVEPDGVGEIVADRLRLQQVFVNLLANAVQHTPPGGRVEIRSRGAPVGAPSAGKTKAGWVAVDVHNSGSYIPPSQLERIFERFYQADGSRASRDGSGLGLAIVREIVQAHHGRVEVHSARFEGTTFTVILPVTSGE